MNDFEVEILEKGYGLPQPLPLALDALKDAADQAIFDPTRETGGEHYQGSLVQLQGVVFDALSAGDPLASDTTLTVVDNSGRSLKVYLGLDENFDSALVPEGPLNLIGVLDQNSTSGPDLYRLLVMNAEDIQVVSQTHHHWWTTTASTGTWGDGANWDAGGQAPGPLWSAFVENSKVAAGQTAIVRADSNVLSVDIRGVAGSMTVVVDQEAVLTAAAGVTVGPGGALKGAGTIAGDLRNHGGTIDVGLPEPSGTNLMAIGLIALFGSMSRKVDRCFRTSFRRITGVSLL
jgi:hypothetical protein